MISQDLPTPAAGSGISLYPSSTKNDPCFIDPAENEGPIVDAAPRGNRRDVVHHRSPSFGAKRQAKCKTGIRVLRQFNSLA